MSRWLEPPRRLRPGPTFRPWLVVMSVTGATVLPTYLNGALTVALPSIGARIGLSPSEWAWPITVLSLVNGAFLLISGGLADAFGRRWIFLLGTSWLAIFSIALAFIRQSTPFIAMSAVLGFGPALLAPAATGIIGGALPKSSFQNGAFAAMGAGQPLGFIIGLLFGGVFGGNHFYILYIINACAAVIFGLAAWTCLPRDGERLVIRHGRGATSLDDLAILTGQDDTDSQPRRAMPLMDFDWFGAILCTLGVILITLGIAFAGTERKGWSSVPVLAMVPVGASIMLSFFLWELHVQRESYASSNVASAQVDNQGNSTATFRAPLIPPSIWAAPCFSALLATVFFTWLSFNTLTYYCTLYFQEIQQLEPLPTSIRFLPMIGVGLLMNVLGGVLVGKVNALYLVVFGQAGTLASCLIYSLMHPSWPYAKGMLWVMCLIVLSDVLFPAAQLFACQTVGPRRAALAGSLFTITTKLASSIGLAATTSISSAVTARYASTSQLTGAEAHREALLAGYRAAGYFCAACVCVSIIIAPLTLRKMGVVGRLSSITSHRRLERESDSVRGGSTTRTASRISIQNATISHRGEGFVPSEQQIPLEVINGSSHSAQRADKSGSLNTDKVIKPIAQVHKRFLRADEAYLGSGQNAVSANPKAGGDQHSRGAI